MEKGVLWKIKTCKQRKKWQKIFTLSFTEVAMIIDHIYMYSHVLLTYYILCTIKSFLKRIHKSNFAWYPQSLANVPCGEIPITSPLTTESTTSRETVSTLLSDHAQAIRVLSISTSGETMWKVLHLTPCPSCEPSTSSWMEQSILSRRDMLSAAMGSVGIHP